MKRFTQSILWGFRVPGQAASATEEWLAATNHMIVVEQEEEQ